MITLYKYKEYLIKTYKYEIDNTDEKQLNRKEYLNNKYTDSYLNKVIIDTQKIIAKIIEQKESNYYFIKIKEPYVSNKSISLNLCGGWFSDIVYEDINDNLISEYILKSTFGDKLVIDIQEKEYEFDTEDSDILSFDYEYFLYLQNIKPIEQRNLIKIKKK